MRVKETFRETLWPLALSRAPEPPRRGLEECMPKECMPKERLLTNRLFIAIPLPARIRRLALIAQSSLAKSTTCRLVAPESLHLTLAFLGDVEEGRVDDVASAIESSCSQSRPVMLRPSRLDHFGSERNALVWLGLEDDPSLSLLVSILRTELDRRSLPYDAKPFVPHITLARRARIPNRMPELAACDPDSANEVALFRSFLKQEGARYEALARCPLQELRSKGISLPRDS